MMYAELTGNRKKYGIKSPYDNMMEIHAFKQPKQYNLFKEAMKAYTNKLIIGISTAGDNEQLFLVLQKGAGFLWVNPLHCSFPLASNR